MELHEYSELTLIKALPETYLLIKDSGLYQLWNYDDDEPIAEQKADESLKDMLIRFYVFYLDEDTVIDLANEDYNEKKGDTMPAWGFSLSVDNPSELPWGYHSWLQVYKAIEKDERIDHTKANEIVRFDEYSLNGESNRREYHIGIIGYRAFNEIYKLMPDSLKKCHEERNKQMSRIFNSSNASDKYIETDFYLNFLHGIIKLMN